MITKELFGSLPSGEKVYAYTLKNSCGASVKIMEYGATVISLNIPDKNGVLADVVCGYDNIDAYIKNSGYQGAVIGRYANRIENSSFTLDGVTYNLYPNEKKNHLHGGKIGFDKKIWSAKTWEIGNTSYIEFMYVSEDMEEGYPGKLSVKVLYSFDDNNVFSINYKASTTKKTVINMTNHSYFNLGGYSSGNIHKHSLWLDADRISVINDELIPTGEELEVKGSPFDFRKEKLIGEDIDKENKLLSYGKGYDHNFFLNYDGTVKHVATLMDTVSGRKLKLYTNQPCIQIYTANCINENELPFKNGVKQYKRCAVCLETQHAPNSPNMDITPSCTLDVGEMYDYTTVFKFEN